MYFALLAALVVMCCVGAGVSGRGRIFDDYMSPARTTSIKGVFAFIIVMSHMLQYISVSAPLDRFAQTVVVAIGQLMVAMFFFYSGYGICESCRSKEGYMSSFFKNRILKTLVHFDMAVVLYILLNVIMGNPRSLKNNLLALTGWVSIGNSNWFVFCTLALYLVTLAAFGLFAKRRRLGIAAVWVLTAALAVGLRVVKEDYWWYNTLLCYPLGMVWSEARRSIEKAMSEKNSRWNVTMTVLGVVFAASAVVMVSKLYGWPAARYFEWMDLQYFYMIFSCIFCLVVVISQMRLRTHNAVLHWLGVHSFSIYILQRLPMRIMEHFGLNEQPLLFIPVALAATLLIAPAFTWLTGLVDKALFPKKNKKNDKPAQIKEAA